MNIKLPEKLLYAGIAAVVFGSTVDLNNDILVFDEFNGGLMKDVRSQLKDVTKIRLPFEYLTLNVSSPGGNVSALKHIMRHVRATGMPVDTLITEDSASAAAMLFTMGKNRMMSEDARILFHRVRVFAGSPFNPVAITGKDIDDFLKTGKAEYLHSPEESKQIVEILSKVKRSDLEELLADLTKLDKELIATAAKNLNLPADFVETKIFPVNVDKWLTAKEAKDLGIVTEIIE